MDDSNPWPPNFGIGIEAGLIKIPIAPSNYMDFQFCVIMDENCEIIIGSGIGFEYPKKVIDYVFSNKKEIGHIMGDIANNENLKHENGAIGYLSKNTIKTIDILKDAEICALLPRINRNLYE
jgi:inosine/xanthosine triphosphatase